MFRFSSRLTLLIVLFFAFDLIAEEDRSKGSITGKVIDSATGNPIPGASVQIEGRYLSVNTDRYGSYLLPEVPTGQNTLIVTSIGYNTASVEVNVEIKALLTLDVQMIPIHGEELSIEAPLLEGQAKALNE